MATSVDETAPASVKSLVVVAVGSSVKLTWKDPAASDFSGVMIRRTLGSTAPVSPSAGALVIDTTKTATSYSDLGLDNGATYSYALFAHDSVPNYAAAVAASVTVPPATVTAVTAIGSSGQVKLKWTNPTSTGFRGVMIRRTAGAAAPTSPSAGTLVADTAKSTTSSIDTGLSAGTYAYALFAHDATPSYSLAATVTAAVSDMGAPSPVKSLTVTSASLTVRLSWKNPAASTFTGVMIRRTIGATAPTSPSAGTLVADTSKTVTSFIDPGLARGKTYSYALYAHDVSPNYAVGVAASATIAPAAVTQLVATPGESRVVLTWTNPATASYARAVVRRAAGATPPASVTDGDLVGAVLKPSTTITDSAVLAGSQYAYAVFAQDSAANTSTAATAVTTTSPAVDTLTAGELLNPSEYLISSSGNYHADMQSDGNFVVYPAGSNSATGGARWSTVTDGNPGAYLTLQADGNLVVYPAGHDAGTGGALWSSGTGGNSGATVKMQDDGNLVLYSRGGLPLWDLGGGGGRTQYAISSGNSLVQGQSLWSPNNTFHADMQLDGNLAVYPAGKDSTTLGAIWDSHTEGNPGAYAALQTDGNFAIYTASGSALWSSGTAGSNLTLKMQDDGNLVIYSEGGVALWSSNTGKLAATQDILPTGSALTAGQSLWALNNKFHADMQLDGNFVVYPASGNSGSGGAIWSTATSGNPGAYVTLQADGNLVIYPAGHDTSTGGALWNSGTEVTSNDTLRMQNDGNLVIYNGSGTAIWALGQPVGGGGGGGSAAVAWATAHNGQVYGTASEQPASAHQWSGFCWTFVYDAFGGAVPRMDTAQDGWNYYSARGMTHAGSPPAGSIAFWSYGTDGHAAVATGGGMTIGTHGTESDRLPVYSVSYTARGLTYLGWVAP